MPLNGPNGSVRRVLLDVAKMMVVATLALVVSFWRASSETNRIVANVCTSVETLRANQKLVLSNLLAIVLILNDRDTVGLTPLPPTTIDNLVEALSLLPDDLGCR